MRMTVTQEDVLLFLLAQGGKVKNSELLKKFKPLVDCPDPEEKTKNRELFKRFVNNVAVVKDDAEGKFVVLKKKYLHLVQGNVVTKEQEKLLIHSKRDPEEGELQNETETREAATVHHKIYSSQNYLPSNRKDNIQQKVNLQEEQPDDTNNYNDTSENSHVVTELPNSPSFISNNSDDSSERDSKRETVFALVARIDNTGPVPVPKSLVDMQPKESVQKPYMLPLRCPQASGSKEEEQHEKRTEHISVVNTATEELTCLVQPRSPHVGRRQYEDSTAKSPLLKRVSKIPKLTDEHKYSDVVPLDEIEHEWLVKATDGQMNLRMHGLLLNDCDLAEKRDFISGFTALHWAAKSGNAGMIKTLTEVTSKSGFNLNVNVKSFGGYTPLHIAAIHNQEDVIKTLVRYNANVNLRDHSGKKPYKYLRKDSPQKIRIILNDPNSISAGQVIPIKRNSKIAASILGTTSAFLGVLSEESAIQDLTKGFKKTGSLNKFFIAPSGPKKKHKAKDGYLSFASFSEESEVGIEETLGKCRPVSEFLDH